MFGEPKTGDEGNTVDSGLSSAFSFANFGSGDTKKDGETDKHNFSNSWGSKNPETTSSWLSSTDSGWNTETTKESTDNVFSSFSVSGSNFFDTGKSGDQTMSFAPRSPVKTDDDDEKQVNPFEKVSASWGTSFLPLEKKEEKELKVSLQETEDSEWPEEGEENSDLNTSTISEPDAQMKEKAMDRHHHIENQVDPWNKKVVMDSSTVPIFGGVSFGGGEDNHHHGGIDKISFGVDVSSLTLGANPFAQKDDVHQNAPVTHDNHQPLNDEQSTTHKKDSNQDSNVIPKFNGFSFTAGENDNHGHVDGGIFGTFSGDVKPLDDNPFSTKDQTKDDVVVPQNAPDTHDQPLVNEQSNIVGKNVEIKEEIEHPTDDNLVAEPDSFSFGQLKVESNVQDEVNSLAKNDVSVSQKTSFSIGETDEDKVLNTAFKGLAEKKGVNTGIVSKKTMEVSSVKPIVITQVKSNEHSNLNESKPKTIETTKTTENRVKKPKQTEKVNVSIQNPSLDEIRKADPSRWMGNIGILDGMPDFQRKIEKQALDFDLQWIAIEMKEKIEKRAQNDMFERSMEKFELETQ